MQRLRRRILWVAAILAMLGIAVAVGWVLAGSFRSPDQIAADSSAPAPSVITATVETGTLERAISVRGTVAYSNVVKLPLNGADPKVVTNAPAPSGTRVSAGDVVAEVNGRPVFALPGPFPLYRDLRSGDTGPDVRAVQNGLVAAGFEVAVDGVLGRQTIAGIEWLYSSAGFRAPLAESPAVDTNTADVDEEAPQPETTPPPERHAMLPMDAVIVAPTLPAIVTDTPQVGRMSEDGAAISFASGELRFVAPITTATAAQMVVGMSGSLPALDNSTISLTLTEVTSEPREDGTVDAIFIASDGQIPESLLGRETVADAQLDAGIAESLVVPTRAVIVRGSDAFVRVVIGDGEIREVAVTELAASLGRSAIEPADADSLQSGDEVVLR